MTTALLSIATTADVVGLLAGEDDTTVGVAPLSRCDYQVPEMSIGRALARPKPKTMCYPFIVLPHAGGTRSVFVNVWKASRLLLPSTEITYWVILNNN